MNCGNQVAKNEGKKKIVVMALPKWRRKKMWQLIYAIAKMKGKKMWQLICDNGIAKIGGKKNLWHRKLEKSIS